MLLHVGLDDTDSPEGGCTTYLAATLAEKLEGLGARFVDYPNLVRLNPNAPWKTRGNAALCIRADFSEEALGEAKRAVLSAVEEQAEFQCDNTNPGVVFHVGAVPPELTEFYERVLTGIVEIGEAERLIDRFCASAVGWKNRRGLVGALSAVGATLEGDHTYELITYRTPERRGTRRRIDDESVREMDRALGSSTFNSVDPETGKVLIAPRGPDPVLFGVRGETPGAVLAASLMIRPLEPVERWMIFRTNQGTDAHLSRSYSVSELKPRSPAVVSATVTAPARRLEGGHAIFTVADESGTLDCAAYEPSGGFRKVIGGLRVRDTVRVAGSVREVDSGLTLNLERLEVVGLARDSRLLNPRCPDCGAGMESMGTGKGFRCRRCGRRGANILKTEVELPRTVSAGVYLPPPRAERHLTKPLGRYEHENACAPGAPVPPWHG